MPLSPLGALKVEDWDRTIDVNLKGVLYGIAAVLPFMREQHGGHIINVSSVAGHKVGPGGAVYSATKYRVRIISEALRQEVKPYNIRTTVISPGVVAAELPASVTEPGVAEGVNALYESVAVPAGSFANMVVFAMKQNKHPLTSTRCRFDPARMLRNLQKSGSLSLLWRSASIRASTSPCRWPFVATRPSAPSVQRSPERSVTLPPASPTSKAAGA